VAPRTRSSASADDTETPEEESTESTEEEAAEDAPAPAEPGPATQDPAIVNPDETAAARVEGTTSDAAMHVEGVELGNVPADSSVGPHSTDAPDYPFPVAGDVEVATVDAGSGADESFSGINADDWVVLQGGNDVVPESLVGARAAVISSDPAGAVPLADKDSVMLTVRTRDDKNATLTVPLSAVKVLKGSETVTRG